MTAINARAPSDGTSRPPKILYIGGTGRTGSTVLGKLLGQFDAVFSAGEIVFIWEYGLIRGGRCSCGARLSDCEVWSAVLDVAFAGKPVDPRRMVELRKRFWSAHLPLMLVPGGGRRGLRRLEEFPHAVESVYRALGSVTGARIVVDSSKEPHYSYILREATNLEVYFLHLVRDPRAVGFSWRHRPLEHVVDEEVLNEQRGPLRVSLYYSVSNAAAEALWRGHPRYRMLRYEDFVERPGETLRAIGEFIDEPLAVENVLVGSSFRVESLHSAWENPNRFERGRVDLTADEAWHSELGSATRLELTGLNWLLMSRYGYRVRGHHPRSVARSLRPLLADEPDKVAAGEI